MLPTATLPPLAAADALRGQPTKEYYLFRAQECRRLAVAARSDSRTLFQVLEKRWMALARTSALATRKD
jgi:hypothetical protein